MKTIVEIKVNEEYSSKIKQIVKLGDLLLVVKLVIRFSYIYIFHLFFINLKIMWFIFN